MMLIVNLSHIKALKIIMFKYAKALASTTFVKGDAWFIENTEMKQLKGSASNHR